MASDQNSLAGFFAVVAILLIYFIPAGVASSRKHHNSTAIFWLNLLLGWTALGWIVSLIWALTAVRAEIAENPERRGETKKCPFCAELVKKEALICRYCGKDFPDEPREIRPVRKRPVKKAPQMSDQEAMARYGITFADNKFHFGEFSYDKLEHALRFAQAREARGAN